MQSHVRQCVPPHFGGEQRLFLFLVCSRFCTLGSKFDFLWPLQTFSHVFVLLVCCSENSPRDYTQLLWLFICEFIIICLANDLKTEHFMLVPALIQKDDFTFTLLTSPGYSYSWYSIFSCKYQYSMSVLALFWSVYHVQDMLCIVHSFGYWYIYQYFLLLSLLTSVVLLIFVETDHFSQKFLLNKKLNRTTFIWNRFSNILMSLL